MKYVRRTIKTVLFVLSIVTVASLAGYAQQRAGDLPEQENNIEEKVIRRAYAKLMMFAKAAKLKRSEDERIVYRSEHDLRFDISNIKTGPVEEIQDRVWTDLVSLRLGEVLFVVPGGIRHNRGPKHVYYDAKWIDAGQRSLSSLTQTVGEVLGSEAEFADVGKYTSYEVTVHYEGRQRSYRAMVIYHQPLQSVEKTRIEFIDNIVGSSAVGEALAEKSPPMRFPWKQYVKSRAYQRERPSGRADNLWNRDNLVLQDTAQEPWPFPDNEEPPGSEGQGDAGEVEQWLISPGGLCDSWPGTCCDSITNVCCYPYNPNNGICDELTCEYPACLTPSPIEGGGGGGGEEEEACRSRSVEHSVVQKTFEDFQRHIYVGYVTRHSGWAQFRPRCVYESDCSATCYVDHYGSPAFGSYDDGPDTTSDGRYHAVQIKSESSSGGTVGRGGTPTCTSAVAMAFKSCTDQFCNFQLSLTFGPSGWQVSAQGFYDALMQHSWECQPSR